MQIINIEYQNEKGDLIERLPINFVDVLSVVYKNHEINQERYPWITSVDPYGDTTFNIHQWPYLISEFTKFCEETTDENAKSVLASLISFLKEKQNNNHTYLKFIGD